MLLLLILLISVELSPVFHLMTMETEFLTQLAAPTLLGQLSLPESCCLSFDEDTERLAADGCCQ